jgi:hypothetical protein
MAQNKKHHFVPRFYLKRFSIDGKCFNLHNLKSNKTIHGANLKNQCYRDYFYGKNPDIEISLAETERKTKILFEEIDKKNILPPPGSPEHIILVIYILIQYYRTLYSAQAMNEQHDKLMKYLMETKAKAEGIDLSRFTIEIEDVARYSLAMGIRHYPVLLDMDFKLLLNQSSEPFITSDNPIVFYNQFFPYRRGVSNTGLASKGLQIFFPLDPKKHIFLYDQKVYGVGSVSKGTVNITDPRDVYSLNKLQVCSASDNVYFRDVDFNIHTLYKKSVPFLRNSKVNQMVYSRESTAERHDELIATSKEDIRTDLSLSFIRITRSAKRWRESFYKMPRQPVSVVRNERLVNDHLEFLNKVKVKEYEPEDFFIFMEKKYKDRSNNVPT